MSKKMKKNRVASIIVTIIATLFIVGVLLGGPGIANERNSKLSANYDYSQIENTTSVKSAPLVDGVATEGAVVSGTAAGGNLSAETTLWDTISEWDQVTVTTTATDGVLFMNINKTSSSILKSDISGLRIKTNCTKSLEVDVYLVKYDGVDVTKIHVFEDEKDSGAQEYLWVIKPIEILSADTDLAVEPTDESYIQIVFSGNGTDKLTTSDVLQFQLAWRSPDNPWAWSSWNILLVVAYLGTFVCTIFAIISFVFFLIQRDVIKVKKRRG